MTCFRFSGPKRNSNVTYLDCRLRDGSGVRRNELPTRALGVRAEMDFSREAAARAAERFLILIPPFTPAACWCARTIVESIGSVQNFSHIGFGLSGVRRWLTR